jgi:hypothetical protein
VCVWPNGARFRFAIWPNGIAEPRSLRGKTPSEGKRGAALKKARRFGPFSCAFLTANAPLLSPKLCGPPTGLTNPVLKVAHRGAPWAAFAEAPALPTPLGSTSTEFDTPGVKAPNLGLDYRAHPLGRPWTPIQVTRCSARPLEF